LKLFAPTNFSKPLFILHCFLTCSRKWNVSISLFDSIAITSFFNL